LADLNLDNTSIGLLIALPTPRLTALPFLVEHDFTRDKTQDALAIRGRRRGRVLNLRKVARSRFAAARDLQPSHTRALAKIVDLRM
jgi:hypothetical protein